MTKKEVRINERNIKIREIISSDKFDDVVVVENYDPEFSSCYGALQEIRLDKFGKVYKKYNQIMSGNYWQYRGTRLIVNESDVAYIWKDRYIVLKKGGVFDRSTGIFRIKKDFLKAKYLWERKVKDHDIWESYNVPYDFNEFGMNYREYEVYQQKLMHTNQYQEEIYSLLEFYGYQYIYERNEFNHLIYVDENDNKFSLTNIDESVSFRFNDTEYSNYNFESAYEKIKELLIKGGSHND